MHGKALLLIGAVLLSGCAQGDTDGTLATPTLFPYTQEQQDQAADELASLPAGSVIAQMIADYGLVRNEIRAMRD